MSRTGYSISLKYFCPVLYIKNGSSQTPGMNSMSLVVGEEPKAKDLQEMITKQTASHEVRVCRLEEAFEACNAQCYLLIWVLIEMPVAQELLSLTTSIRSERKSTESFLFSGWGGGGVQSWSCTKG